MSFTNWTVVVNFVCWQRVWPESKLVFERFISLEKWVAPSLYLISFFLQCDIIRFEYYIKINLWRWLFFQEWYYETMLRQHGHNYGDGIWSIRLWSVKFECDQISYLDNWIRTGAVNRIVKTVVKHYLTSFFYSSVWFSAYICD